MFRNPSSTWRNHEKDPVVLAAFVAIAGCSTMAADGPVKTMDGVLIGAGGMTLYTFDRDAAGGGKSVCNGSCATALVHPLSQSFIQASDASGCAWAGHGLTKNGVTISGVTSSMRAGLHFGAWSLSTARARMPSTVSLWPGRR